MPAEASLPVRADSACGTIDPAAQYVAELISEGLDANEMVRRELVKLRQSPGTTEAARVAIDVGLGRLARAHRQLVCALRDVEQAGGAS